MHILNGNKNNTLQYSERKKTKQTCFLIKQKLNIKITAETGYWLNLIAMNSKIGMLNATFL